MLDRNDHGLLPQKKKLLPILIWGGFLSIVLFLLLFRLNNWPTVWWDEGWTLSAARNWLEHGHLGNYLDGLPVPPRIPLRFPVVVPVALSMKIFGVGVWQGRLPGVIFTVLMLVFYVYIISKMYNPRTGVAAMLFVLCLSPFNFQPLISGRQVMAEMPMMFFLLGGYSMYWLALSRSKIWGLGAAISFGIAIHTKLQVPPFWLASIALAIWVSVKRRHLVSMKITADVAVGSILIAILVYLVQNMIMPDSFADPELLKLLLNTSVITLDRTIRLKAIYIIVLFALPELLGFIWVGRHILRNLLTHRADDDANTYPQEINRAILQAAIWGLGVSWMIWYGAMSMYWIRYIFPAYFIGLIFVSAFISERTNGYDLQLIFQRASSLLLRRKYSLINFQSAALVLISSIALGIAISTMRIGFEPSKWQPEVAANYLQNNIPTGARIETYESELLFLVPEFSYHFPPDLVSMKLYRRADFNHNYPINYDPLITNPDYLVVGPFAQVYGLYEDKLLSEWFVLDTVVGGYQIYHKKNPQ